MHDLCHLNEEAFHMCTKISLIYLHVDSYCIVHLPEKTHNNAQFFKNEMVDKLVDKENVHFVYMYIYIEVPITFVSMGYEQRN